MLVLSRKTNERLRLRLPDGSAIWVTVVRITHNTVRIGVAAPPDVDIAREELIPRAEDKR